MSGQFIIPLNGLPVGRSEFVWRGGKEFFSSFDDSEIIDAEISATALVEKTAVSLKLECSIEGWISVPCDRCLEELEIPVNVTVPVDVRFGNGQTGKDEAEDKETICLAADADEIDLTQIVYDYSLLALPMRRSHEEGGCNRETLKYLRRESDTEESAGNSPFAALQGLFEK